MLPTRKKAKRYLQTANRLNFMKAVYNAKVTPRQQDILYKKFLEGMSNTKIAMELYISVETVRNELAMAYDMLFNHLFTT